MKFNEITTYEAVCAVNKQDPNLLPDVSMLSPAEAKSVINSLKLERVIKAINTQEDGTVWEPDWSNRSQPKYFMWFEVNTSGAGFDYSGYGRWRTDTYGGSRLCLESAEKVKHVQKHFEALLIECYLIIK